MKSLICSDSHDHVRNFEAVLMVANTANCDSVLFCGDLCSSFMLDVYNMHCKLPMHLVFGNNDGDKFHLLKKATKLNKSRPERGQITLHGEFLVANKGHSCDGIPKEAAFCMYHYPEVARTMAATGQFNLVCYGHTHVTKIEKMNNTLLMNPGSVMGFVTGDEMKQVTPSCLILNWKTGETELIEL